MKKILIQYIKKNAFHRGDMAQYIRNIEKKSFNKNQRKKKLMKAEGK